MAECGYFLGRGVGSAINVFNPGIVTVGGGLVQADNELADRDSVWGPYVAEAFAEAKRSSIVASGEFVSLRIGTLGNQAGLRGAGVMAAGLLD
jgi:predicted NBD/HSP70 family sugar kinase